MCKDFLDSRQPQSAAIHKMYGHLHGCSVCVPVWQGWQTINPALCARLPVNKEPWGDGWDEKAWSRMDGVGSMVADMQRAGWSHEDGIVQINEI